MADSLSYAPYSRRRVIGSATRSPIAKRQTRPLTVVQQLQTSVGNRATQSLLAGGLLQPQLRIGPVNDVYEREADQMADGVMRMPDPASDAGQPLQSSVGTAQRVCAECQEEPIQRMCAECEEEEDEGQGLVQRKPRVSGASPVNSSTSSLRGGGQPLPPSARSSFEPRFGHEFRQASVHYGSFGVNQPKPTPASAMRMADPLKRGLEALSGLDLSGVRVHRNSSEPSKLNAFAYVQGRDIYVGPRQEKHLPHEGWHAVQQMQGRVKPTIQARGVPINDDASLEREADVMGAKALHMTRAERTRMGSAHQAAPALQKYTPVLSFKTKGLCKTKFDATKYVTAKVEKGDRNVTGVVNRLMKAGTISVNGRRAVYATKMQALNYTTGAYIHIGDCLIMLKTWNDPNIGTLPPAKSMSSDLMIKIISTIYGEQTQDVPDQHLYIWRAMRKMIESWEKPAKLIYPGAKKGVLSNFDAFGNKDYYRAKSYLKLGKSVVPKSQFNQQVVDKIKAMVTSEWSQKIPQDAGMFYFHWTRKVSPSLNNCWADKANAKKSDKVRESICVEKFRKKLGWVVTLVKTIPPTGAPAKGSPPFGTMYVFKSTKQP